MFISHASEDKKDLVRPLAEELVKAHDYEVLPVEHPDGEHMEGEDGFMEFHMKDGAAIDWVLEHMYSRE